LADLKVDANEPGLNAGFDMGVANFDGSSSQAIAAIADTLKLDEDATISFWIKSKTLGSGTHALITYGGTNFFNGYMISQTGSRIQVYWKNAVPIIVTDSFMQVDHWYHIVVIVNAGVASLYVNNTLKGSADIGGIIVINTFTSVGSSNAGSWFYHGYIPYLKIHGVAKDPAWVAGEYNRGDGSLWKSEYGAIVSGAAVTSGCLSNTPFLIDSGSWKISASTIDGLDAKVIECVTAGIIYIISGHYSVNPTSNAYGEFGCWINKAAGHTTKLGFMNQNRNNAANGYGVQILTGGDTSIVEWGVAFVVTGGVITPGQLTRLQVKRYFDSQFEGFIDGVSFGTGLDLTNTEAYYTVFECGAGDEIVWADRVGGHAFVKRLTA
jgi:hypothetical protein